MMNISRASITEKGEHSSRQIISLEMTGSPDLKAPTAESLNAKLPKGIHVFKVIEMSQGFSARRSCEARTFEFVFPTYVLAPPPEGTLYANPLKAEDDDDFAYPTDMVVDAPAGGMFKTLVRGNTTAGKTNEGAANFDETKAIPMPQHRRKKGFAHWFSKVLFGNNVPEKIRKQEEIDMAIQNGTIRRTLHRKDAPTIPMELPEKSPKSRPNRANSIEDDKSAFTGMGGFFSTLKRTMSTKRRKDSFKNDESDSSSPPEIKYFEPLDIPLDEVYLSNLASYRITESQIKTLKTIISLYNGTHNWHNYIPGASADDSRCYLRILNVELSAPEMHDGLEWLRVKVQAKAFARYQIRKMIALAILVIHTNTPVSVIGNSFGHAKIEFPEAPALGLILDEPHYTQFNDYAIRTDSCLIDFESIKVSCSY
jgi:tRNA pseudouridine38-40 synthase